MSKTKDQVTDELNAAKNDLYNFYKCGVLETPDYCEICLDFIEKHKKDFCGIKPATRKNNYKVASHSIEKAKATLAKGDVKGSGREEERLVLKMYAGVISAHPFGKILDYQVPLKNKKSDKHGKIDFICEKSNELWLVEIKRENSDESILRAIMEIVTYYQVMDKEKLLDDFGKNYIGENNIKKKIAIFKGSVADKQLHGKQGKRIKEILDFYDIEVLILPSEEQK